MKKHIPNLFTCLNLLSGCIAITMVFRDKLEVATYFVFIAVIFDFLDGLAARMLNAYSTYGKELDSLADVVTFGLVPGSILYKLLQQSDPSVIFANQNFLMIFQFFPFIVTIFSAVRLARFNVDKRQSESFIGLPTPANALLIISLPLIVQYDHFHLAGLILNPYFLAITCIVLSYLLIAEIPLFALKFKSFAWKKNAIQYIFLGVSAALLLIFEFAAIPLMIFLYLFLSLINNINVSFNRSK